MIAFTKKIYDFIKTNIIKNKVNLFITIFIFFLVLRDIVGVSLNRFVFIGISTLLFIFCDENGIVEFIAFIIPISLGISYSFISFIAVLFLILKRRGKFRFSLSVLFPIGIAYIELLNMFYPNSSMVDYFRIINIFILFTLMFLDNHKSYNYKKMLKLYLMGFFTLSIFTLFFICKSTSIKEFFKSGITLGEDIVNSIEGNKVFAGNNSMGLYAVISISVSMLLFYAKAANKYILIFMICLGFIMGFISTSRGFIFSTLLCFVLFGIFSIRNIKSFLRTFLITLFLLSIAFLLINSVLSNFYDTFIAKMTMEDFSNGRYAIFEYYNKILFSDIKIFLIGVGIQNYQMKCATDVSIHNAIQEVLIAWGIFGLICVAGFFISLYKSAVMNIPKGKKSLVYLVPALVYLFYVQFNQLFSVTSFSMVIVIAYCSIALNSQENIEIEKKGIS